MRLFQNSAVYPGYIPRLRKLDAGCTTFLEARRAFLNDRFGACHILRPVLLDDPTAFFANGHDEKSQRLWAREHGLANSTSLRAILCAQIEEHKTEIFYNLDPMRFQSDFVRSLPACVKHSIAWRAAPSPGADFARYDCVVSNFPQILDKYASQGWRVGRFFPAVDPVMDEYVIAPERATDVVFVGGYSRHHRQRAEILEHVAKLCAEFDVAFHLDCSRLTRFAESPLGALVPLASHRRPRAIRDVALPAVFGRELYAAFGAAKIVLNGAIDMAGSERGNMRCFEATGCGALLVTDDGQYPEGFTNEVTMCTFSSVTDVVRVLRNVLRSPDKIRSISSNGAQMVRSLYSKDHQWRAFVRLVEQL